jgi:hypothetical protein
MRKLSVSLGLLALLVTCSPALVSAQKKAKEQNATTADYKSLENSKELDGTLIAVDQSTRHMTLKVGYSYLEPNPQYKPNSKANADYVRRVNKLIAKQQEALTISDPVKRMKRLQELSVKMQVLQLEAPVGPPPFRTATAYKDYIAEPTDDLIVRRSKLPQKYDDKGNPTSYTEQEKKELRGKDTKIPGYAALWADVQKKQQVKLYLKSKKDIDKAKKKADTRTKADKAKNEDALQTDATEDTKAPDNAADKKSKTNSSDQPSCVYAYMILIESDPASASVDAPKTSGQSNN